MRIKQNGDDLVIFFKLVKAGYGSLNEVKEMNSKEVVQALYYEEFLDNCIEYRRQT